MTLTLSSIFRDATEHVDRYFDQINALREHTDVRLVITEGDSTDGTYDALKDHLVDDDVLIKVDHGGQKYGSVNNPDRWRRIALVVRATVRQVIDPEVFVWVEGDLLWQPTAILALVDDLERVPAVAPAVKIQRRNRFYDVWGFRRGGLPFEPFPPFCNVDGQDLIKIDSCGSCFVTNHFASVAGWNGMWPFTADGDLWFDPTVSIEHPWMN